MLKAPSCVVPTLLMDNHKNALAFWRDQQVSGAVCVHVDAHLDVSNMRTTGRGDTEEMGVDCGNFLYSAMQEGLVKHLVWVIPPCLAASSPSLLAWSQHELQNWMRLTTAEYRSLRVRDNRVEGILAGARLTICTADDLPPLDPTQPILVDLDVDYFLAPDDAIWQTPIELHERLAHVGPTAITVTTSVEGGHTPPQHRYLGNLSLMCFSGKRDEARVMWDRLQAASDQGEGPEWFLAARLALSACRQGQGYEGPAWDAAASHDCAYHPRPLDMASYFFRREDYDACLKWLDRVEDTNDLPGVVYHRGLVACRRGDFAEADERWQELLGHPVARGGTAAHLHEMRGRTLVSLGRDEEALVAFRAALTQAPRNAPVWRQVAQAQRKLGLAEQAARSHRRAVALAPNEQATLAVLWDLAQWYADSGEILLAQAALRQVVLQDEGALRADAQALYKRLTTDSCTPEEPRALDSETSAPPEPPLPPPTQELVDLCHDVRRGATDRVPELETRMQAGRLQLAEASEAFGRIASSDDEAFACGRVPIIEAVHAGFDAYARAFDWIESYLRSRDGVALWHAMAGLAGAARHLSAAQSAYEASVLTSGACRFPTMNVFHNLARQLRSGEVTEERWKAACQGHRPLFAGICASLPQDEATASKDCGQASSILEALQRMEDLGAESSSEEFAAALDSLMQAHVELEAAVAAHHARICASIPTECPGANRILLAAGEGRLTPALLDEAAHDLQEQVHRSIARIREAVRIPTRSVVAMEEIPRILEALESMDEALENLLQPAEPIAECELALWQLQDGARRAHVSHETWRQHQSSDGTTAGDLAGCLFEPRPHASAAPPLRASGAPQAATDESQEEYGLSTGVEEASHVE